VETGHVNTTQPAQNRAPDRCAAHRLMNEASNSTAGKASATAQQDRGGRHDPACSNYKKDA